MAWTVTRTNTVFGNQGAVILHCVADAAEQNIQTGLKKIVGMTMGHISLTTALSKIAINSNSTGVAADGTLGCSGFVSGDVIDFVVYGPR